mgnify:FL=1
MPTITLPEVQGTIEEILTELDAAIQKLAKRWARDCPHDWEDLAQEARLAIYRVLKENPACPCGYLFQVAKHEVLDYRRKGKSVDGKLDKTYGRQFLWALVRRDAPGVVPADDSSLHFKPHQLRPVEDLALTLAAYGELRGRLTEQQARYLSLRLQGYLHREIGLLLGLSRQQGERVTREIKKEAAKTLLAP